MWQARNKTDLIIEVWEKLDCESIGRTELEAIEAVVEDVLGKAAVDPPMMVARLLADEGAQLRHAEIMDMHVERASDRPYDAAFRNIVDISGLDAAHRSIRDLDNLRRKYRASSDNEGLRRIRETAIEAREKAAKESTSPNIADSRKQILEEINAWLRVWLETPAMFDSWLSLRRSSPGFIKDFGASTPDPE